MIFFSLETKKKIHTHAHALTFTHGRTIDTLSRTRTHIYIESEKKTSNLRFRFTIIPAADGTLRACVHPSRMCVCTVCLCLSHSV